MIDLHVHSDRSDGVLPPGEVVAQAARAGLTGLALTDHDTTDGWAEAAEAAEAVGLWFVPGVELSTEEGGASVHVLGYGVDGQHPALVAELARLRAERLRRAEATLARLADLGVEVRLQDVLDRAGDAAVARPHVAEAMVAAGAVPDVPAAFDRYLADGAPAYEPKRASSPEAGVRLVAAAGGAAVLAHPGLDRGAEGQPVSEALFARLVEAGLGGVEAGHPGHDHATRGRWAARAEACGLVVTAASDFHGRYDDEELGRCATSVEAVERLLAAGGGRPRPEGK